MFGGIADFAMRGRWQAALTAALLSALAMMLPPVNYLASGVIALTTLRMGPSEGTKVVTATIIVFALLAGLFFNNIAIAGLLLLSSWLPVFLVSIVLGYSRSLAAALLAGAGIGIVSVVGLHLFVGDVTAWWQQLISPFMATLADQPEWTLNAEQTAEMTARLAAMMTGLMAAGLCFNAVIGLIIGRAWQAKLYNPGGFGEEFRQLRLGNTAAVVTAIVMGLTLSPLKQSLPLLADILPVMMVVFVLQALAVAHAFVHRQKMAKGWLVAMYVLLILPQMVIILAVAGVLDQWFNFRKRIQIT